MLVVQDGSDFYNDETGELLYQSSSLDPYWCREDFLDYCEDEGIYVEWGTP